MFLAIDVGNSSLKFGVYEREKLLTHFKIPIADAQIPENLHRVAVQKLNFSISAAAVSSVVPELNLIVQTFCENLFNVTPIFIDANTEIGFPVRYEPPEKLGADRFIAAFAAADKYAKPIIVCDFGTATTIDYVNADGEFCGGIITPGISTLSDALYLKTSKLPRVEIIKPEKVVGSSTVAAIQSGIFYGYIGLVEGLLQRIIRETGEKPKIAATGGFAFLIKENCDLIEIIDEFLMLDGLRRIYYKIFPR